MSLGEELTQLERIYDGQDDLEEEVEPIRQPPHCGLCGLPIGEGLVHIREAVRPEPGDDCRWHLVLCDGCAKK